MISLYNTLTRQKGKFTPLDENRITLYACGPTVYNYIHVGNARMIAVFDLLYRLLRRTYGEKNVIYVRNITDIEDKIIDAALKEGVSTHQVIGKYLDAFIEDQKAINTLEPTHQPLATQYLTQMIAMIEKLIANGHAYEKDGHVLFNVPSYTEYGKLSRRDRDEQIAGARVEVAPYKKDPADFVLWKPSTGDQPGWDSPWGFGRPGWHIECSAMATDLLGRNFDIHGGGIDLVFPHHENEIAQSCCADKGSAFAQIWMHNGFLNINNEKMSKSLGNFHFLRDVLKEFPGEAVRYVLLSAQYRQPLEFNFDLLTEAKNILDRWYRAIENYPDTAATEPTEAFLTALSDDLNTPAAYAELHRLVHDINKTQDPAIAGQFKACAELIGLVQQDAKQWFRGEHPFAEDQINAALEARRKARAARDFAEADRIRKELETMGIVLDDRPDGSTLWRKA